MTITQKILDDLTEKYIKQYSLVEAIILVGSYANGYATDKSDIDLCIIGDFADFKRKKEIFKGKELELMIASYDWFESVINEYERKDNYGTVTGMLSKSKCLYSINHRTNRLIETAQKRYLEGPREYTVDEKSKLIKSIKRLLKDVKNTDNESFDYKWTTYKLIDNCVDSLFKVNRWWYQKENRKMSYIKDNDFETFELISRCMSNNNSKVNDIEELCEKTIEKIAPY